MAGKLSFQIEMTGDQVVKEKLKQIENFYQRMLNAISGQSLMNAVQKSIGPGSSQAVNQALMSIGNQSAMSLRSNLLPQRFGYSNSLTTGNIGKLSRYASERQGYIDVDSWISKQQLRIGGESGGSGGGGGRGGRGGGGNIPGGLGGAFSKLAFQLAAITTVIAALKSVFEKFKDSVYTGAKLYTDAAKLGKSPEQLYGLRAGLGLAGISESQADLLMLYGEFPRTQTSGRGGISGGQMRGRGGASMGVDGTALGAGRGVRQIGSLQEVANLYDVIDRGIKDTAVDSAIMAKNAKSLFETRYDLERFKGEWNTLWSQLAETLGEFLHPIIKEITEDLKQTNKLISDRDGKPKSGLDFHQLGAGGNTRISANQFQRMGFVFGAGNYQHHDYAKKTADSTHKTAVLLEKIVKHVSHDSSLGFNMGFHAP